MILQCFIPEFKTNTNNSINLNNVSVIKKGNFISFILVDDKTEYWSIPSILYRSIFNKIVKGE